MAFAPLAPPLDRRTATGRGYYRLEGMPGSTIVLAHSLGLDHTMWDPQVPDLLASNRVLRYDLRGHGASDAPAGDYSVADLGRDALSLLDALQIPRVTWCGSSLGGMVGQWLAVHAPERLTMLILANTSPRVADPAALETRRRTVLEAGMTAVVDAALARFFTPAFLDRARARVASTRATLLATPAIGYAGCCAALRDFDGGADLARIATPTLVIGGDVDPSMPWDDHGARLVRGIPGATAVRLATAHLSNLELPRTFTRALLDFLTREWRDDVNAAALDVRREVLGADHVRRRWEATTELTAGFENLITRYAWGAIWTRPGLDHRTRRLLVLATTAALGRWEEFRLHLGAGVDRELEWSDVEEVLLQTAIYAGVPAANTAFAIAAEEHARRR